MGRNLPDEGGKGEGGRDLKGVAVRDCVPSFIKTTE